MAVGVIGDFQPEFRPHKATNMALEHAAAALGITIDAQWLGTIALREVAWEKLEKFDALWCAPGSPYRSLEGALCAVRFARECDRPLLGTCGGFQHMVLEYARNVLGVVDAQHAEYDPYSSELFVSELSCSLAGNTMSIKLAADSLAGSLYGSGNVLEQYYCNFGLDPRHRQRLEDAGLRVVGEDQDGEARVIELPQLRFYLATLFVPQMHSAPGSPHPLVIGLLKAALTKTVQSSAP
ncbi:MAG: CTP synthase C-terminal region-related (seleno)protein [Solirubrobacteraceae bacterium]